MDVGVTAPDQLNIGAQVKNSLASIGRPKIELLLSDKERSQSQPFVACGAGQKLSVYVSPHKRNITVR